GLAGGGFVATWSDASHTLGDPDDAVHGQIFTATGAKVGTEFLVNATASGDQFLPDVAALPDGRFVAAWTDFSQTMGDAAGVAIHAQVFDANGSKSGAELLVNTTTTGDQNFASVSVLTDGRFVISWTDDSDTGGDTSKYAVRAQIFDPREGPVYL